jgi:hypothetical protein
MSAPALFGLSTDKLTLCACADCCARDPRRIKLRAPAHGSVFPHLAVRDCARCGREFSAVDPNHLNCRRCRERKPR